MKNLRTAVIGSSCALAMSLFAEEQKPNIILMYVDDLDFDQISAYADSEFPCYTGAKNTGNLKELSPVTANENGQFLVQGEMYYYKNPTMLTPNIDRLAAGGMKFNRFYVTSSICTPSRYSMLTGRYASRSPQLLRETPPGTTPLIGWNSFMDPDESNLARSLKSAGYVTGLVGKWHLSSYELEGIDFGAGFDSYRTRQENRKQVLPHQMVGTYFPLTADYGDPAVQTEVKRIYEIMSKKVLTTSGFDVVDRLYFANYGELPIPLHMKVHNLEWETEGALDFIDANKDRPFFLYFAITPPHGSYTEDWMSKDWRATPAGMLSSPPRGMPSRDSVRARVEAAGLPPQNAMATWIDDSLGAILNKLDEAKLSGNTIVLFISDNQSRGKLTAYEGHRVPAIILWPRHTPAGSVEERIVANIDIRPTLLEIAGVRPADNETVDGKSLVSILEGKIPPAWRDSLFLETAYSRAVITKDWKYIANRPPPEVVAKMEEDRLAAEKEGRRRHVDWSGRATDPSSGLGVRFNADQDFPNYFDSDQLYNLKDDVFEQRNLFSNPEYKATASELHTLLGQYLKNMPRGFGEFR